MAATARMRATILPLAMAGAIAAIGLVALVVDFTQYMTGARAEGANLVEAAIRYCRYFTILANGGTAVLMSVTTVRIARDLPLPDAGWFRAATVYMIVTAVTYELLLRSQWSPHGVQFATDLAFHDIVPALLVLFWWWFAPKRGLRLASLGWLLLFPACYFTATLTAGAFGAGYPYNFLDAAQLGLLTVIAIGTVFLALFWLLGALLTMVAARLTDGRRAAASRPASSCTR